MSIIEDAAEKRNAAPIMLQITPTDRHKALLIAKKEHIPLATWVYKIFKEAIEEEEKNQEYQLIDKQQKGE